MTVHAADTVLRRFKGAQVNLEVVKTYQRQSRRRMLEWVHAENSRRARQDKDELLMVDDPMRGLIVLEVTPW